MSKIKIEYPEGVCDKTKNFIDAFLKALEDVDSATVCDTAAIWMLMVTFDSYIKASMDVLKRGNLLFDKRGRAKINPSANMVDKKYTQIVTLMKEFGFTLKSRERIKALSSEVDEDNPLYQFLKNNK